MRVLIFSVLIAFSLAIESTENGNSMETSDGTTNENIDQTISSESLARSLSESEQYTVINSQPLYTSNLYPSVQPVIRSVVRTNEPEIIQLNHVIVPYTTTAHIASPTTFIKTATPIAKVQQVVSGAIVNQALLTEKTQYHSQDELGRATYGHAEPLQTHNAYQDENGGKSGSFSYIAPNGKLLTTTYSADANGYRAKTNALPIHNKSEEIQSRRRRSVIAAAPISVLRKSTLTQVVNNPGHAISYRVDPIEGQEKLVKSIAYTNQPIVYSTLPYATTTAFSAQPIYYNSIAPIPAAYQKATLTNIVHTPGHAASYRVDPN